MRRGSQVHSFSSWARKRGVLSGKRGLSEIIGYVLLISITMILSVIVYQWLKTYVPRESIECDDGVSIFVESYDYDCGTNILNLNVTNSGRFDIAGYFIHATTTPEQKLAVTDLSNKTPNGDGGVVRYFGGGIDQNPVGTESQTNMMSDTFNLATIGRIYSIQIVPLRYQEIDGKTRPVACTNGKIKQELECAGGSGGGGAVCGDGVLGGTETCDDSNVISGDGCSSTCQVETGWSCVNSPMPSICTKNSISLFYDGFDYGPANPLSNGWTSECTGSCGGTDIGDIYTSTTDPTTSLHNSYYMVTKDTRTAIRTISTTGYGSINLTYWRTSNSLPESKRIIVQWRADSISPWSTPLETLNPGTTWAQKTFPLTGAESKPGIQIRFYTDGGNTDYALWDDINVSAQVL